MKKVIMLLSGPCDSILDPDPRVENEAESLAKASYNVRIFAWDRELKSKRIEKNKGFIVERIRIKSTFGKGSKQIFKFLKFNRKVFYCQTIISILAFTSKLPLPLLLLHLLFLESVFQELAFPLRYIVWVLRKIQNHQQ